MEEKIIPGKHVSLIYDLYAINEDGLEVLAHQSDPKDPEQIIFGVTPGVIEPLEKALDGLKKGDGFNVIATAEQAFGPHIPEQVAELAKDMFVVDGKFDSEIVAVGKYVPMLTAEGYRISGLVVEITDTIVKMDFNHPLAGKSIRFIGKVLDVCDATDEELHVAAAGCHCGDGGCGEGCADAEKGGCCGSCKCD